VSAKPLVDADTPKRRYADTPLPLPLQKLINDFGEPVADPINMRYFGWGCLTAVSYTHLTLPTICSV